MSGAVADQKDSKGETKAMNSIRRLACRGLMTAVGCLTALALVAPAARAAVPFSITEFGASTTLGDQTSRQAGEHADFRTEIEFAVDPTTTPAPRVAGQVKDVRVDLPPGLVANPTAAPACAFEDLLLEQCPAKTQIGVVQVRFASFPFNFTRGVYNLPRPTDAPAFFGFIVNQTPVFIKPEVRASDYGISSLSLSNSQGLGVQMVDITLWGAPGDSSHNSERYEGPVPVSQALDSHVPFMRNPTSCSSANQFSIDANSWENPEVHSEKTVTSDFEGNPFVFNGCEKLSFGTSVSLDTDTHRAETPSGLQVAVDVPQNESPDGLATPDVRKTVVTFPKGVAISTSAASGQGSCAPDQIMLGSNEPPTCPDSSKVGTVEIETPLLDETLQGNVILAKQNDNPFNSLLALYIVAKGPGFYLKLPGKVGLDPSTGQVTTTFDNTPQLPFEHLRLQLNSGSRAPLVTPSTCGTYDTQVEMTSWASSVPVKLSAPMTIDEGCGTGGFSPTLKAGTTGSAAGSFSPFLLRVLRNDGEQNLAQIDATLPPGVLAKLAGVAVCPDSAAASGSCPAVSQVGTTTVGAGAGPTPVFVPEAGRAPTAVYLAGPYKGAPYSLVVKVPAQAGPFDLGTVTVRNALFINPETTQVTAKSDPLPQILQGIPVSYRDVRVEVNKPDFTLNPTNCDPMEVESTLVSAQGQAAHPSAHFQAVNCERLGFEPKLLLSVKGATHRSAHPAFKAVLTMPKANGANIQKAQVTLPKTELLENAHIRTICTRVQYAAGAGGGSQCPAASIYGKAKAWSPLLDKPLEGPVYLRSSSHQLPDLVASLGGQIHVDLVGRIDAVNARIRNTFETVPDAPVTRFVLQMQGGKKGLLANNTELCKTTPRATVKFDAQNGKVADMNPVMKAACGKARKRK